MREEFLFDLADIVAENKDDQDAQRLLLHFFLVRDIERTDTSVIKHLHDRGYFNSKYEPVISKLLSDYYTQDRKSEKISWSLQARIKRLETADKIGTAVFYLKLMFIYVFLHCPAAIYLWVFKIRSVRGAYN